MPAVAHCQLSTAVCLLFLSPRSRDCQNNNIPPFKSFFSVVLLGVLVGSFFCRKTGEAACNNINPRHMKNSLLLITLCLTSVLTDAWAQQRTVSGRVTAAEDGATLPGVNVVIKGTAIGTVTDIDGNYSISVPKRATLVFSFIGHNP